jgi:hypothetical protein
MNFNLNEKAQSGVTVFNNGVAGKVENVSITVEKRRADEPDSYPTYKLIVDDGSGSTPLNQGFYINESDDESRQNMTFQRVKSISDAVVPEDFVYPEVNGYMDAMSTLFKVIKENADGKKVSVFTTYGYSAKPSKYLGLRMFDFIQSPNAAYDKMKPKPSDILVRPEADAPSTATDGPKTASEDIW